MADLNSKVVSNHVNQIAAGKYALVGQNERGEMFVEFAERHNMKIHVILSSDRIEWLLYTWTSAGDRT